MKTQRSKIAALVVGILGTTVGGCSSSGASADGPSGTATDVDQGKGGASENSASSSAPTGGTSQSAASTTTSSGAGSAKSATTSDTIGSGGTTASRSSMDTGGVEQMGGTDAGKGGSGKGSSSKGGSDSPVSAGGTLAASGGRTGTRTRASGGAEKGGTSGLGGNTSGSTPSGGSQSSATSARGGATANSTSAATTANTGTCTASKPAGKNASGSGPHKVTVETNTDAGIKEGTIYRPTDLGGDEKYPIFVWGEGGCSLDGSSNAIAMGEIASYGYFVIADGTPGGTGSRSMDSANPAAMGKPLLAYIDWAIAENEKPCSAYYHSLDTTKIASNGFSCGGLMAEGTAGDPRITTWGLNSSGMFSANQAFYKTIHTPVLLVLGGPDDIAYENGERDYDNISTLAVPVMLFSKALGHGGDLFKAKGGDFTRIDLAWLNWWLKGDEGATGKGVLVGSGCTYCTDSAWEVKSKNIP